MELGEKLKAVRMEKNMTLEEVAKKSSLTKSFISQIELNKTLILYSFLLLIFNQKILTAYLYASLQHMNPL